MTWSNSKAHRCQLLALEGTLDTTENLIVKLGEFVLNRSVIKNLAVEQAQFSTVTVAMAEDDTHDPKYGVISILFHFKMHSIAYRAVL